jgi:hypothetical protein
MHVLVLPLQLPHAKVVLNAGSPMESSGYCEHRLWSNVGRESFAYLTYILHYMTRSRTSRARQRPHGPEHDPRDGPWLAPITVFCQIDPSHFDSGRATYIDQVCRLLFA